MGDAKTNLIGELERHGRQVSGAYEIELRAGTSVTDTLIAFTGGRLEADRLVIVTAQGPWGAECIVQPLAGYAAIPGEYHLEMPGALRSAVEYRRRRGGTWSAGDDQELATWLKKQKYETYLLPDDLKQGTTRIKLDSIIQLHPVGPTSSALVFTLGGIHTIANLEAHVRVAEELAGALGAGVAPGPLAPLEAPRFAEVANAAHRGEFDGPEPAAGPASSPAPGPPAAPPAPTAPAEPSVDPAVRVAALTAALQPHLDKRVLLPPIDDKTLGAIAKKVAPGIDSAQIVAFLATGVRASGKVGLAFTSDTVHIGEITEKWSIRYDDIRSFSLDRSKVHLDSASTGAIELDVFKVTEAVIPALVAVTGLAAS